MLRRLTLLLVLPLAAAPAGLAGGAARAADPPPPVRSVTTFAISGHGFGHGVGMGQWGAYGLAKEGAGYEKILAHYYPGTVLGRVPATTKIRVLLSSGASSVSLGSTAPFTVEDGDGASYQLPAGVYSLGTTLKLPLPVAAKAKRGKPARRVRALAQPLTFVPSSQPLELGGQHPYRGRLEVQLVDGKLQVVNVVGVDAYVRGVVTQEMPKDWPLEALKAQAVAARSFALALRQAKLILYPDQRGQVYGGLAAETPSSVAATEATRGQVLEYGGNVALTLFSSSSGGRTAALTDFSPAAKPVPYLVSVPDPSDAVSPYHDWGPVVLPATRVAKLLGVRVAADLQTEPATGHAHDVVVTDASGQATTLAAEKVRLALGLKSTWFTASVLTLSRPAGVVHTDDPVTLSGVVKRVQGPVTLQFRRGDGEWQNGPTVKPGAAGAFSVQVTPGSTTFYRLAAKTFSSDPLRVPVAPPTHARSLSRSAAAAVPFAGSDVAAAAFLPNDPLSSRQWYLAQDRAFDYWPDGMPALAPVKVAVVDTGIDLGHPEFQGRIAAARSFVGGGVTDTLGHGTFVAGIIGAATNNAQGVAGIAFPAQLIVAKVVDKDGSIRPGIEAQAIRWAVDEGARVINLSLGGVRDPARPKLDSFSPSEQAAVEYAYERGALVVAAVGNGDEAPSSPWPYASYPAALPHVLGVSALTQRGGVPSFSNRDPVYNDVAAPGEEILSTFPRALTHAKTTCVDQGYSDCGPPDYVDAAGTSFAAPQVAAAAALILAAHPSLRPDQVAELIEESADDVTPASGCHRCAFGHDALSGFGRLDVAAALEAADAPPPADRLEPNDDGGRSAPKLWGQTIDVTATISYWDDPIDVYRVWLRQGQRLVAVAQAPTDTSLVLWRPGTSHVTGRSLGLERQRLVQSSGTSSTASVRYQAARGGWYLLEVRACKPGSGSYTLRIAKTV